jgi:hypothetical protein
VAYKKPSKKFEGFLFYIYPMKYIKRFNEAIVVPDKKMLRNLYSEIESILSKSKQISFDNLKEISEKYGINIISYDEFYNLLSDNNKKEAPPKGVTMFGYTNAKTGLPYVILNRPDMNDRLFVQFKDTVEHELVHSGHRSKREWYPSEDVGPGSQKKYFSDKDEVMAMSKSISYLVVQMNPKDIQEAVMLIDQVPLYKHIKNVVDSKLIKRNHKYIYMYLEDHFENVNKPSNS